MSKPVVSWFHGVGMGETMKPWFCGFMVAWLRSISFRNTVVIFLLVRDALLELRHNNNIQEIKATVFETALLLDTLLYLTVLLPLVAQKFMGSRA